MKRYFPLAILLLLSHFPVLAQDELPELRATLTGYFDAISNPANPAVLDHIYPKLFDHYPRPMLEASISAIDDDSSTLITLQDMKIEKIAKVLTLDGIQYTLVDYGYEMKLVLFEEEDLSLDEEDMEDLGIDVSVAEMTYGILKGQYGDKNTRFNPETGTIDVHIDAQLYAILDPAYPGWKFLEKKDSLKEVLALLLPEKVLQKL